MTHATNQHASFHSPSCDKDKGLRRVSFAPNVRVSEIPCIDEMEYTEIGAVWYDIFDFAAMRADVKATVAIVENKLPLDLDARCTRGLEHRLCGNVKKEMRQSRSEALDAVLEVQAAQYRCGRRNSDLISEIYSNYSAPCQALAYHFGQMDEEDARSISGATMSSRRSKHHFGFKQSPIVRRMLARLPKRGKPHIAPVA
eukprot:scaffold23803_cov132-Cylindrotheca_fusiformis.AAC.11